MHDRARWGESAIEREREKVSSLVERYIYVLNRVQ